MTADVRATVAELRQQLVTITDQLAEYAPPLRPSRFDRTKNRPGNHGPVWDVPSGEKYVPSRCVSVRALDKDDPPRCVYVQGSDFSYYDDWSAFSPTEARAFAMALLAAADWADDADPLHKRRVEADEKRREAAS